VTSFQWDLIGRLVERIDDAGGSSTTNTWTWDPVNGMGQLGERENGIFTETYTYRAADSKLQSVVTDVSVSGVLTASYAHNFTYDTAGRLSTVAYPNLTMTRAYTANGYLHQYKNGSTVVHEFTDTDAFGNLTHERFWGNASQTTRTFDAGTGVVRTIQSGTTATPKSVQDLEVVWRSNGSVYKRIDHRNTAGTGDDYTDTFTYDTLERLTKQATTVGATRTLDFAYDAYGNLTSKVSNINAAPADLDATAFAYGTAGKPHRLTSVTIRGVANTLSYDSNGNITQYDAASGDDTTLQYDAQNYVKSITVGATPTARDEFWYDPDGQRFLGRETWQESGTKSRVTAYVGAYEELIPASNSTYSKIQRIQATPTAQFTRRTAKVGGAVTTFWLFLHRDHLGSVDVLASSTAVVTEKTSFDPFGRRREKTWASDIGAASFNTLLQLEDEYSARGFTDHEHLNRTGFIHMNGRVYDPRIGRIVSPDPFVQAPYFSQSYNRYAYVFNSPMSSTDPSGFFGAAAGDVIVCSDVCLDISIGIGGDAIIDAINADIAAGLGRIIVMI
jgi:RHS repeat-associated protein